MFFNFHARSHLEQIRVLLHEREQTCNLLFVNFLPTLPTALQFNRVKGSLCCGILCEVLVEEPPMFGSRAGSGRTRTPVIADRHYGCYRGGLLSEGRHVSPEVAVGHGARGGLLNEGRHGALAVGHGTPRAGGRARGRHRDRRVAAGRHRELAITGEAAGRHREPEHARHRA